MDAIRNQIDAAVQAEQQDHLLRNALQARHAQAARLVELPEQDAGARLLEFVTHYIRSLPGLLNDLETAAADAGLSDQVEPLIAVAREFFALPAQAIGSRSGLTALMVKAYLGHRLLEEVNEACLFHTGEPMIPMDMTMANIIVHTLIGEPFANDMDSLVHSAVERLFHPVASQDDGFREFMNRLEQSNLVHICRRIPSLSGQAGLQNQLL